MLAAILLLLLSCEKEITVDLPQAEKQIVVDGSIFPNEFPLVLLTWTQGYFDPTDINSLQNIFVHDADVTLYANGTPYPLIEFCSSDLNPAELEAASAALGVSVEALQQLDLCLYTSFALTGAENTVYRIEIKKDEYFIQGETKIPGLVELDTVYFDILNPDVQDTLGILYGRLTDPDSVGNAYRWFAKRINHYPMNVPDEDLRGRQKDLTFIAPFGSVYDDSFFNGLSFEFAYPRGIESNSTKFDDNNEERAYFKVGDTVAIRGCTIDRSAYKFIRSMESQIGNQGSPFAIPFNLESNLTGGLGAFIGYGAIYDTLVCD
ncbi:MAG: DUF4249 domain-containing protein [Flavobacteriales bacterium]